MELHPIAMDLDIALTEIHLTMKQQVAHIQSRGRKRTTSLHTKFLNFHFLSFFTPSWLNMKWIKKGQLFFGFRFCFNGVKSVFPFLLWVVL